LPRRGGGTVTTAAVSNHPRPATSAPPSDWLAAQATIRIIGLISLTINSSRAVISGRRAKPDAIEIISCRRCRENQQQSQLDVAQ